MKSTENEDSLAPKTHRSNRIKIVRNPWSSIDENYNRYDYKSAKLGESEKTIWDWDFERERETFLWRALSSLETLAFSFMVGMENRRRRRGRKELNKEKQSARDEEVNTVFLLFSTLSLSLSLPLWGQMLLHRSDFGIGLPFRFIFSLFYRVWFSCWFFSGMSFIGQKFLKT